MASDTGLADRDAPTKGDPGLNALLWWLRSRRWADRPTRRAIPDRLALWLDQPDRLRVEVLLVAAAVVSAHPEISSDMRVFIRFYGLLGQPQGLADIATDHGITVAAAEAARRRTDRLVGERLGLPPAVGRARNPEAAQSADGSSHLDLKPAGTSDKAARQRAAAMALWELTDPGLADVMSQMRVDQQNVALALLDLVGLAAPQAWSTGNRARQRRAEDRRRGIHALDARLTHPEIEAPALGAMRALVYRTAQARHSDVIRARYQDRLVAMHPNQFGVDPDALALALFGRVLDVETVSVAVDAFIGSWYNEESDTLSALTVTAEALAARGDPSNQHGLAHLLAKLEAVRAGMLRERRDPRAVHAAARVHMLVNPYDPLALVAAREVAQTLRDLGLIYPARQALTSYRHRVREAIADETLSREDAMYERGLAAVVAGAVSLTQAAQEHRSAPGIADMAEALTALIKEHRGIEIPNVVANVQVLRRRVLQLEVTRISTGSDHSLMRAVSTHIPALLDSLDAGVGPRLWRIQHAESILAVALRLSSKQLYTAVVQRLPGLLGGEARFSTEERVQKLLTQANERGWQ